MSVSRSSWPACLLLLAGVFGGCGRDEGPFPMQPGRERPRPDRDVPDGAGTRERLGLPELPPTVGVTPAGWTARPPDEMRLLSYTVGGGVAGGGAVGGGAAGGGGGGDLSVSRAGGSVADNVNRWRKQVGLPPLDEAGLAALPRRTLLGSPAVLVEVEGAFQGMSGPARPDMAILGLVSERERLGERMFVKLVAPKALVAAERASFEAFVGGLAPSRDLGPPPPGHAQPPASARAPRPTTPSLDPTRLRYDLPAGWSAVPTTKPFRLADFRVEGAAGVEGVLSHLGGDGGGLANNLNRWRGQMGQPELTASEIAALEQVEMLGGKATWVEIPGHYRGMSGEDVPEALFLGVVCLLPGDALFVRLYGPKDAVAAQRDALRALVRSMRVEP